MGLCRTMRYDGITGCQPGAQALNRAIGELWPATVDRTGIEGEGRSIERGCGPGASARGELFACTRALAHHGEELGVALIVFDRQLFRGHQPTLDWIPFQAGYGGPHLDHAHIELTRLAARTLTYARAMAVLDER